MKWSLVLSVTMGVIGSAAVAQKRLVEANLGIALLAESGIEEETRSGTLKG